MTSRDADETNITVKTSFLPLLGTLISLFSRHIVARGRLSRKNLLKCQDVLVQQHAKSHHVTLTK